MKSRLLTAGGTIEEYHKQFGQRAPCNAGWHLRYTMYDDYEKHDSIYFVYLPIDALTLAEAITLAGAAYKRVVADCFDHDGYPNSPTLATELPLVVT